MHIYRNASTNEEIYFVDHTMMNPFNTMHGGDITKLIDDNTGRCCHAWCNDRVSTATFHNIRLLHPIYDGDRIRIVSTIIYSGRTSLTAIAYVILDNPGQEAKLCAHAVATFVRMANDTESRPVPPLPIDTPEAQEMADMAKSIRRFSQGLDSYLGAQD